MTDGHALGPTGRARGVEDVGQVVYSAAPGRGSGRRPWPRPSRAPGRASGGGVPASAPASTRVTSRPAPASPSLRPGPRRPRRRWRPSARACGPPRPGPGGGSSGRPLRRPGGRRSTRPASAAPARAAGGCRPGRRARGRRRPGCGPWRWPRRPTRQRSWIRRRPPRRPCGRRTPRPCRPGDRPSARLGAPAGGRRPPPGRFAAGVRSVAAWPMRVRGSIPSAARATTVTPGQEGAGISKGRTARDQVRTTCRRPKPTPSSSGRRPRKGACWIKRCEDCGTFSC